MKRIIISSILVLALFTGCTREIRERVEKLDEHLTELETQLEQQNQNIVSLHTLFQAVRSRDFITGITQLEGNAGYAVHFNRLGDIVIYHGTDAHVPRVGIKRNPSDGNYYWTIQYGNGEAEYIINDTGNMVSAVGMVPLLKIENGKFYISYDNRASWQYLGEADGVNGDSIFKNIRATQDYVLFITEEEEFKVPTNSLAQSLYQNALMANQNLSALSTSIDLLAAGSIYVVSVNDVIIDDKVAYSEIKLSNGESYLVHDYVDENVPMIIPEMGELDSVYFWAYYFPDGTLEWIRDKRGHRMPATGVNVEIPVVKPLLDTTDHIYYWNAIAAGDTTKILDQNGNKVMASSSTGEFAVFKGINNNNPEYLQLTLANGTVIKIPKIYTISFVDVTGDRIKMAAGASKDVKYKVYGADASARYDLATQGSLTVTLTPRTGAVGEGTMTVRTGADFTGKGKVLLVVSAANSSNKTMTKILNVALEEE